MSANKLYKDKLYNNDTLILAYQITVVITSFDSKTHIIYIRTITITTITNSSLQLYVADFTNVIV